MLLFVFGTIIGSFLNVVGLRFRSGITLVGGRSFCPVCHKELQWWELVPVVSFFVLRGRCSACKSKISWQYPLVEIMTGVVFVSLYRVLIPLGVWVYILSLLIFCIYIVILIYDFHHKIIPDPLVFTAIALSLIVRVGFLPHTLLDLLAGPILFAFFASIWLLSKGRAMGFGDAKLALSIGLLLGLPEGISALILAFWCGTLVALPILILQKTQSTLFKGGKRLTMKSEIPFAPFLILGAWLSLVFHFDLFHVTAF